MHDALMHQGDAPVNCATSGEPLALQSLSTYALRRVQRL